MLYPVYLVEYLGAPRNHHVIFVELDEMKGSGFVFHVSSDIQKGMQYEVKPGRKPEESVTFETKSPLGWVDNADYNRVNDICASIPPPKKQFAGPKRLYPKEPLRRCQEWTQEAIQALRNSGVLRTAPPAVAPLPTEEYWTWSGEYGDYHDDDDDGTFEWARQGQGSSKAESKEKGQSMGKDRPKKR